MKQFNLFNDTVCEVMNLAGGKRLVRDSKGEEFEVYEYELSDIPLSQELLEHLGFRFDKVDYKINGWECYRLTKVEKVYLSPSFFVEEEMYTPLIGYAITADGEEKFSIFTRKSIDNRIGTCRVKNLNEFLYLCERLGCRVEVNIEKLNAFMRQQDNVSRYVLITK